MENIRLPLAKHVEVEINAVKTEVSKMRCSVRQNQRVSSWVLLPALTVLVMIGGTAVVEAQTDDASLSSTTTHEVIMHKMRFIPEQLTIHEGDRVRWVNREKRQYHNVWFEEQGEVEPDYLFPDEQFEKYFYQQGDYPYRCGPHPLMLGKVTVLSRNSEQQAEPQSGDIQSEKKQPGQIDQTRQAELLYLLKQDCGSCHGMRLKGGLGSSLLPEDLAAASVDDLTVVILEGRPGTAMPPWKALLSEADARWISQLLKSGAALE